MFLHCTIVQLFFVLILLLFDQEGSPWQPESVRCSNTDFQNCSETYAVLWCVVTRDIQEHGMSHPVFLLESDQWDAVLCAMVVDLDFDGQKEVLIGTYGQVRGGRGLSRAIT